ncbi:MAG: hypothetical protein VX701_02770 [Chloroflexota bacterium]|nr:hypothetical protein [Chloroflexota bacterium]
MSKKPCPRCQGYMYMNRDTYGNYIQCIQCGHLIDVEIRLNHSLNPNQQGKAA